MQRQRYWVERVFEDAKSECGMADYQVRKWQAWHHHMALVMMAMLFMLTERMRHLDHILYYRALTLKNYWLVFCQGAI